MLGIFDYGGHRGLSTRVMTHRKGILDAFRWVS